MKAITLRNIPPRLASVIRQRARAGHRSLNRTVIEMLESSLVPEERGEGPRLYHDLDGLAGSWSRDEAAAFEEHLRSQRQVESGLWK